MTPVYLALGANIGPRRGHMRAAVEKLTACGRIQALAPLYEGPPYGKVQQPAFYNSALILQTNREPLELLGMLKQIEKEVGRRPRYRWGPREIDVDIIFFGRRVVRTTELTIPHADYANRRFVLQPLSDIAPDFIPPGSGDDVQTLLEKCPDRNPLNQIAERWI